MRRLADLLLATELVVSSRPTSICGDSGRLSTPRYRFSQHQNLLVLQLLARELSTVSVQDESVGAIAGIDDL